MKRNPYQVLDVPVSATEDEIRAAYLRKSKETHPDAGGSAEAFREVKEAYDLLRDSGRRARFDATGRDLEVPSAKQLVVMAWSRVMSAGHYYGADLVAAARSELRELMARQSETARSCEAEKQRLERVLKRLERRSEAEPILEEFVQTLLDPVITELCKCRLMIERATDAIGLLGAYAWSVPKEIEGAPVAKKPPGKAISKTTGA